MKLFLTSQTVLEFLDRNLFGKGLVEEFDSSRNRSSPVLNFKAFQKGKRLKGSKKVKIGKKKLDVKNMQKKKSWMFKTH